MRDHSEESFSDGTPLPARGTTRPGKGKGPSQAQQLMAMAEDTYRLIRSADGRAYAVPKMGPQIAVPLASKSGKQPPGPAGRLPAPADRPGRLRLQLCPTASPC